MRHVIRDSFIWCCDWLGISYLYRAMQPRPLVRVIAFHDINNHEWFHQLITELHDHYHIISPADFEAEIFSNERINVLLTFDDGYQSWVNVGLPILEKYNIKALFFVSTGLTASADDPVASASFMKERLLISPKAPLTEAGIQALAAAGHTVGAHTHMHQAASQVAVADFQADLERNIETLEHVTATPIEHFAYPFGRQRDYTKATTAVASKLRLPYIYIAETSFCNTSAQGLISRTLIEKDQPLPQIHRWMRGGYDIFARIVH